MDKNVDRAAMTGDQTRELLEQLPDKLGLQFGSVRIHARFRNGRHIAPLRVAQFRIPAGHVSGLDCTPPNDGIHVYLEQLADGLGCIHGDVELIAEYDDSGGNRPRRLRWLDVVYEV